MVPVTVSSSLSAPVPGAARVRTWSGRDAFKRGGRRAAKIIGVLICGVLPFAFLEPFAFMVWGSVTIGALLLILGPYLHLKYWSEKTSFDFVEAECPSCHAAAKLGPYLTTEFSAEFIVICPACGQTATVRA